MTSTGYAFALFDTAIGIFGIAWSASGIVWVQLPSASMQRTRSRLLQRYAPHATESVPPPSVQNAIDGIIALVAGQPIDLTGVALDMDGVPEFDRRVYEVARTIPPGSTLTYGQIAARLGDPREARAVGQALGHNPFAIVVPCHRVLAAGGKSGGFSASGGVATKVRLLTIEGAPLRASLTSRQLSLDLTSGDGTPSARRSTALV